MRVRNYCSKILKVKSYTLTINRNILRWNQNTSLREWIKNTCFLKKKIYSIYQNLKTYLHFNVEKPFLQYRFLYCSLEKSLFIFTWIKWDSNFFYVIEIHPYMKLQLTVSNRILRHLREWILLFAFHFIHFSLSP